MTCTDQINLFDRIDHGKFISGKIARIYLTPAANKY